MEMRSRLWEHLGYRRECGVKGQTLRTVGVQKDMGVWGHAMGSVGVQEGTWA